MKFELMLIQPMTENTLKFPSKFKLEMEEIKALEVTLNPSALD